MYDPPINYFPQKRRNSNDSNNSFYSLNDNQQFDNVPIMPPQSSKPKKIDLQKQLEELLLSIAYESMETQMQGLNDVFETWRGNLEQVDDVCIIGVRV